MKVLVIGSGGREHALVWKIAQSPLLTKLFAAPGNAGIADLAHCFDIQATDTKGLLDFAKKEKIDLTVVGPEAPLVEGITDLFRSEGLRVFGPSKAAAQLEGSKIFSKQKMKAFGIPTARFEIASSGAEAEAIIRSWTEYPVVIKADGLAAGKGVVIAKDEREALATLQDYLETKKLGRAGEKVVIEEFLQGEELSILVLTDGEKILPLASSQDHKRAFDNDEGPNTGGMGAYSPCPFVSDEKLNALVSQTVTPLVKGLLQEGIRYQGLLYAGLMLTAKGPYVLEYNVRFGDPETEAVLPRLRSDLLPVLVEVADGKLKTRDLEWDPRHSITVVMASQGYPDAYEKGFEIQGFEKAKQSGAIVFHAGTVLKSGKVVSAGGRVLDVTALGTSLKEAARNVYRGVSEIHFKNAFYRSDIAKRIYERSVKV